MLDVVLITKIYHKDTDSHILNTSSKISWLTVGLMVSLIGYVGC